MKKFLSGFLAGAIIFSSISVFAASYVAEQAGFKIFVNGNEFKSNPPAVVISGKTYLPLSAMGNALGVNVEWNSQLGQVEVGTSPNKAKPYSRTNPAPIGTPQKININSYKESGTLEFTVIEVIGGKEASERIAGANEFNSKPSPGYEFILARVKMKAIEVKTGSGISISNYGFDAYSNDDKNNSGMIIAPNPRIDSYTLKQGEEKEGFIALQIKSDDTSPKAVYQFTNDGGIWFKLQ